MPSPELTDEQFVVLQAAVNIARNEQVQSVDSLKGKLERRGHAEEDITAALKFWASRIADSRSGSTHELRVA